MTDHPGSWDTKALEVAKRFVQDTDPQRLASLQCAVLEAMRWVSHAHTSSDTGYRDAFFEIGDLMGLPAQPISPREVYETQMKPKIVAAIAALSARPVAAVGDYPAACNWPPKPFTVRDMPGEHDPCYLIMPGGQMLAFVHDATNGVDQARAQFVADACNAALASPGDAQREAVVWEMKYPPAMPMINLLATAEFVRSEERAKQLAELCERRYGEPATYRALAYVTPPPIPAAFVAGDAYQDRVGKWMDACFPRALYGDMTQRCDRFLEESLELLQAQGYDRSRVATLVDYVWNRPVGHAPQEVGGTVVTLAALCWVAGIDMQAEAVRELNRIERPEVMAKIQAKQEAKNALHFDSPLPGNATRPAEPDAAAGEGKSNG